MATIDEEIRRRKIADALLMDASGADNSAADAEIDIQDAESADTGVDSSVADRSIYEPATKKGSSFVLVPVTPPPPEQGPASVIPPEATPSPAFPRPKSYDTRVDLFGGPSDIQTDPETGTRFVQDPQLGIVPHAELATEADKLAQPPGIPIPKVDVSGNVPVRRGELIDPDPDAQYLRALPPEAIAPVPDQLTQVEKALPAHVAAPDKLAQVERGQIVGRPAPATLSQVESGQLISTPPGTAPRAVGRAALIPEPPKVQPPAPVLNKAGQPASFFDLSDADKTLYTSGINKAQTGVMPTLEEQHALYRGNADVAKLPQPGAPVTQPGAPGASQPVAPPVPVAPKPRFSKYGYTQAELDEQQAGNKQPTAAVPSQEVPSGTYEGPPAMSAPNGQAPAALIIHHTSGRGNAENVAEGWRTERPGVGAQMIMDRDGTIHDTKAEFGYGGTGNFLHSVVPGVSNHTAVGIEVIAKDDADMTPAQLQSLQRLAGPGGPYADTPVYGHSQVSPGDRENEGVRGVAAINEARAGHPSAGQPAGQPEAGAKPGYISGRATTFGYHDPMDEGVGAPRLGKLDSNNTTLLGVAVPEVALNRFVSQHPSDWRKARVEVTTQDGRRLLVPIVDLGPKDTSNQRGVVADFTQGLTNLTGNTGEQNYQFRIIPNAGPDVMSHPQAFADEQAALKAGVDLAAPFQKAAKGKQPSFVLAPIGADQATTVDSANTADQIKQTNVLDEINKKTENPASMIRLLDKPVDGVTDVIRKAYQDNYKQELTKSAQEFYNEKDPNKALARAMQDPDAGTFAQSFLKSAVGTVGQVDVGLNEMSKNSDLKQLDRFAQILHPESDGKGRSAFIKTITDIKDPAVQSRAIGNLWAQLDPTRQSSIDINGLVQSAQNVSDPKFQAEQTKAIEGKKALIDQLFTPDPRMKGTLDESVSKFTGQTLANVALTALTPVLRVNSFAAQIYDSTEDRLKREHPGWTDKELSDATSSSTFLQLAPQEALIAASHGILAPLINWAKNPMARLGIVGGTHTLVGAAGGGLQQVGANVAENKAPLEGVPGAMGAGAVQAAPFAIHGGLSAAMTPRETPVSAVPEPERPIQGPPEAPAPVPEPITRADVLGPDVPDMSLPWYKPGPIISRATERETFTPSQLARATERARQAGSPEQIRVAMEAMQPPVDFNRRTVHLEDQPIPEALPVPTHTQEDVARATYENMQAKEKAGQPATPLNDYAKAQRDLYNAKENVPVTVGESEPHISAIANRFTAERVARGEIGEVAPGEGYSKEELRMAGLKMGPEEVNQHVSDLMHNTGNPKLQAAAVTAEEARLSQRAQAASREATANPNNQALQIADNQAFHDLTDFHNGPVAKLKNNWHAQGMTLQGEVAMDLSTFNGLRERFLRETGKAPPSSLEPKLKKLAQAVSDAAVADKASMQKLGQEVERQSARRKLPTEEELRNQIAEVLKAYPCRT